MSKYAVFTVLSFLVLTVYGLGFGSQSGQAVVSPSVGSAGSSVVNSQIVSAGNSSLGFNINNPSLSQQGSSVQSSENGQTVLNNSQTSLNPENFNINNPSLSRNTVKTSLSTDSFAVGACVTSNVQMPVFVLNLFKQLCGLSGDNNPFIDFCKVLNSINRPLTPPSQCAAIGAPVFNQSCTTVVDLPYSVCRSYWNSGWQATWYGPCPKCPDGYTRDSCDSAWWDFAISSKTYCHKDTTVVGQCPAGQSVVSTYTKATSLNGVEDACDTTMIISNVNVVVDALAGTASISWIDSVYGNASVSYSGPVSGSQSTPFVQAYNHNVVLTGLTNGDYNFNIQSCNAISGCGFYNGNFNVKSLISFLQINSPVNTTYTFNTPLFLNFTVNGSLASYNASYIINNSQPVFLNVVNGFNSIQLPNLSVGSYGLTLNVYAGSQNASQTVWFSVINGTPVVNLTSNSWSLVYGNVSNVSCSSSDNGSVELFRNGSVVSNPDVEVLGGGVYNYTCAFTGYGYTPTNVSDLLTVTPGQSVTMVLLNNSNSNAVVVYGDSIIANYSVNAPLNTVFYLNGSVIPDNFNTSSLSSGFYNFTAVTQGNANYSGSSDSKFLTVQQANSSVLLLLNGVNGSVSVLQNSIVNVSVFPSVNDTVTTLISNLSGVVLNTSSLSFNFTPTLPGVYTVTSSFAGNQNYSASSSSHLIQVNQLNFSNLYEYSIPSTEQYEGLGESFHCNYTDGYGSEIQNASVFIEINNVSYSTVFNGDYVYSANLSPGGYSWYCNASSVYYQPQIGSVQNFTVLQESPNATYSYINASNTSVGVPSKVVVFIADSAGNPLSNVSVSLYSSRNDSINPLSELTDANGFANFTVNSTIAGVSILTVVTSSFNLSTSITFNPGSVSYVIVSPSNAFVQVNSTQQFNASAYDAFNNTVNTSFTWNVSNSIGSVDSNGLFTATSVGSANVTATSGSVTGTASVTVTPGSLNSIVVNCSTPVVQAGVEEQCTATGYDSFNNSVNTSFTWSEVNFTGTGVINASGVFTGFKTGIVEVIASSSNVSGIFNITITSSNASNATSTINATSPVYVNSTASVSVSIEDAFGNPVSGDSLNFYVNGVYENSNTTDLNGNASFKFFTTLPGVYSVIVEDVNASLNLSTTIQFLPLNASTILISAPSNVTAGSVNTINFTVTDALGNPVNTSLNVSINNTQQAISVLNGFAQYDFSENLSGDYNLSASTSNAFNSTIISVTASTPVELIVTASPSNLTVGSSTIITSQLFDAYGNQINSGTVSYSSTLGVLNSSTANVSNPVSLYSNVSGTANVTAAFNNLTNYTAVVFNSGTPALINASIPATLNAGEVGIVNVSVEDAFGNPVNANVSFSTTLGSFNPVFTETINGSAQSAFESNTSGVANITITAGNLNFNGLINVNPGSPASLIITAPSTLPVNNTGLVEVNVFDAYNNPISTMISFNASSGVLTVINNSTPNASAEVYSNVSGVITINATAGNVSNTTTITFTPLNASNATSTINATSPVDVNTTSSVLVTFEDAFNNPIQGDLVNLYVNNVLVNSTFSNSNGSALFNVYENQSGFYNVTAEDVNASLNLSTTIQFLPLNASTILISASTPVTAGSTSLVNFTVSDAFGNPVDGVLNVSINNSTRQVKTVNGFGQTNFSENLSGDYNITAILNNVSNFTIVSVTPASPAMLNISANPVQGVVGSNSTITVLLSDAFGNAISNQTVNFSSTSNLSTASNTTDSNGSAATILTLALGVNTVLASWNSTLNSSINVTGIQAAYNVSVNVYDQNNNPLSNAVISIPGFGSYNTNASGSVVILMPSGAYLFTASKTGYVNASQNITVDNNTSVFFTLVQTSTVNGFVNSTSGSPISNALIQLTSGSYNYSASSNANGAFSISNVVPILYNITASASNYVAQTFYNIPVYSGQTLSVQFNLTPFGGVNGTVVDALNGSPISNANVSITQNGVLIGSTLTNANGGYYISVPPGFYNVTVTASSYYGSETRDNVMVWQGVNTTINFGM